MSAFRRFVRPLRRLPLLCGWLFATQPAPAETSALRVALAPIGWEFFDGQESFGESLTPLLLAELSADPRWTLVERVQLDSIEREWALNQPGVVDSAASVVRGRLLGADWMLVLRPAPSPEHPAIVVEVVDTLRAETVSARPVALRFRPRARWFRNPPADDLDAVLAATRQTLDYAASARAAQAGKRAAALLFIHPDDARLTGADALMMERAIAAAIAVPPSDANDEGARDWRTLGTLGADAPRGEGLLRAVGFIDEQICIAPSAIADAFLWGRLEVSDDAMRLRFWLWPGSGRPMALSAEGDTTRIAREVARAVRATPARPTSPPDDIHSTEQRRRLALELVEEARALASSSAGRPAPGVPSLATRLLELAAFLDPLDREIQELRILSCLHDLPEDDPAGADKPAQAEARRRRINLALDYARLADRFWRLPGEERYDLRLLDASFTAASWHTPGARARALRAAPIVARMPLAELKKHRFMLEAWLHQCRTPDDDGFKLLEHVLPLLARLAPERLETPAQGGFRGWIPDLVETYPDDPAIQARLRAIVDGLPRGKDAVGPVALPGLPPARVDDSPRPRLAFPARP